MHIRAAVHVHSNWSYDGHWPLSTIADWFPRLGFHCALMAEHDATFTEHRWQLYRKACKEISSNDFLILPGIEYSDPLNIIHILVWGDMPFLGFCRKTEDLLRDVSSLQGLAVLAHPSRKNAWQQYRSNWVPLLLGIEQWNRKVDGVAPSQDATVLLEKEDGLLPFGVLDFHQGNQFFPLYMVLQLSGRLNEKNVLDTLREKRVEARMAGLSTDCFFRDELFKTAQWAERSRQYLRKMIKG